MKKTKRQFTGVWIPAKVWLDADLTITEKFILAEITALDIENAGCYAGNRHFADAIGCVISSVSNHLSRLKEKGYLTISYADEKTKAGRVLQLVASRYYPSQNVKAPSQNVKAPSQNVKAPSQNVKHKEHLNNNENSSSPACAENAFTVEADFSQKEKAPAAGGAAVSRLRELAESDYRIREGFTMSRKIPAVKFDEYVRAFEAETGATGETHKTEQDLIKHFLNFSGVRYSVEKKDAAMNTRPGSPTPAKSSIPQGIPTFGK